MAATKKSFRDDCEELVESRHTTDPHPFLKKQALSPPFGGQANITFMTWNSARGGIAEKTPNESPIPAYDYSPLLPSPPLADFLEPPPPPPPPPAPPPPPPCDDGPPSSTSSLEVGTLGESERCALRDCRFGPCPDDEAPPARTLPPTEAAQKFNMRDIFMCVCVCVCVCSCLREREGEMER